MLTQSFHVGADPLQTAPHPLRCQLFRAQTDNPKLLKAVLQQLGVADTFPTAAAKASRQFWSYFLSLSRESISSDIQKQRSMVR